MKIYLQGMEIENFKKIQKFSFGFEENKDIIEILGLNKAGKSTLADAYRWLLDGKNYQGKSDFSIKPIRDGKVVHGLTTYVSATFDVDGEALKVEKTLEEKWTRKRGEKKKT